MENNSQWNELNKKANELFERGDYSDAAKLAEAALEEVQREFGSISPQTAQFLDKAEKMYLDAFEMKEKAQGAERYSSGAPAPAQAE